MLADADQIRNLVYLYAELLDAGDFDAVARLFAQASFGAARRATPLRGATEVRSAYDRVILYDGLPCTKHVITNVTVAFDEADRATARSYFTVLQARPDFALQPVLAGRYHDRFERSGPGWRFAARVILTDLVGDLSRHLRSGPSPEPGA